MPSPRKLLAKERFLTFLEGKALRMTSQRQAIPGACEQMKRSGACKNKRG